MFQAGGTLGSSTAHESHGHEAIPVPDISLVYKGEARHVRYPGLAFIISCTSFHIKPSIYLGRVTWYLSIDCARAEWPIRGLDFCKV